MPKTELNTDNPHELLTIQEAAKYLRIPAPTAYFLARDGRLPGSFQIGGRWRVKRSKLDAFIESEGRDMGSEVETAA